MSEDKKQYKIEGRPNTIFRVNKSPDNPYVMIDRRPIDNPELSFKAKGILTYLMSRPNGWEVNITDLMKHGKEGAAAIRTGLRELRDARHVCYLPMRDKGRITGWLIEVYEIPYDLSSPDFDMKGAGIPQDENEVLPDDDFQQVENLQVENRGQVLKTLSSNELNNGDKSPMPLDWIIAHDEPVTPADVRGSDFDVNQARNISQLIDMQCSGAGALALTFMEARKIIFSESQVKGQRKAAREMLHNGVRPRHVVDAVHELTGKKMTVTDLYSVTKTAINIANPPAETDYNPLGLSAGA